MSTRARAQASALLCWFLLSSFLAQGQTTAGQLNLSPAPSAIEETRSLDILPPLPPEHAPLPDPNPEVSNRGLISRSVHRGLEDQKSIYLAPLKPKHFIWDIGFLAVTAGLLAVDRQTMRDIGKDHLDLSHNAALVALLGTSAVAGGTWAYGLKTGNRHADETGALTLESLANTFLIYSPMQLIAGRERPDDGTGNGRFLVHHSFNTSFPAGHPMFTWAMASVVAHEYPKPWVKILMYGAASTVTVARLTGRNHFPSDLWVGTVFGYLIGTHIFHTRCDPTFSEACHRTQ